MFFAPLHFQMFLACAVSMPVTDRRSGMGSGQFESFRSKRSKDDNSLLGRRGSMDRDRGRSGYEKHEKHHSWSPDVYGANLENFRPVTLTVSSFFKQVGVKCCFSAVYFKVVASFSVHTKKVQLHS